MEEAKKNVEICRAALEKLNAEKGELSEKIESLQAARAAAVRALAGGDESKRKVITKIEEEIAPLNWRMEGLSVHLIPDAEAAVAEANEELEEIQAEEKRRQESFIALRDREEAARIAASLPERAERIAELHHELCQRLADVLIDTIRFEDRDRSLFTRLEEFQMSIPVLIADSVKAKGLRPLMMPGSARNINVWPLVRGEEVCSDLPVAGPLYGQDVARLRTNRRHAAVLAEYEASKK